MDSEQTRTLLSVCVVHSHGTCKSIFWPGLTGTSDTLDSAQTGSSFLCVWYIPIGHVHGVETKKISKSGAIARRELTQKVVNKNKQTTPPTLPHQKHCLHSQTKNICVMQTQQTMGINGAHWM